MVKPRFSQLTDKPKDAQQALDALYSHVQALTETVSQGLSSGLTISENLQMDLRTVKIESGVETIITTTLKFKPTGAVIVNSNGAAITSYKTRSIADGIGLTVICDATTPMLILITGA